MDMACRIKSCFSQILLCSASVDLHNPDKGVERVEIPIGNLIKLKRIELGMSQEELARGICASSYLSRIENNKLIPNEDIYVLLLKRLGLDYDEIVNDVDTVDEEIEAWYRELIAYKYDWIANGGGREERDIAELQKRADLAGAETGLKLRAVYCRYLLEKGEIREAVLQLEKLKQAIPQRANRTFFIYANVMIFSFMLQGDYRKAIDCGLEMSKVKGFNEFGDQEEMGIFFYNIALSYMYLNKYKKAKDYAEKALGLFNNGYHLERSFNTLIILGACETNLNQFTTAEKTYNLAKKLLNYLPKGKFKHFIGMIENNLGVCKILQGSFIEAIHYFEKALEIVQEKERIVPLINLVYSCYVADKIDEARGWMEEILRVGLEHLPELYRVQIEILDVLLDEGEGDIKEIERVQKLGLDYLLKNDHLQLALRYAELFIHLYEKKHYYKKANELYKIIQATQREMIEGGW